MLIWIYFLDRIGIYWSTQRVHMDQWQEYDLQCRMVWRWTRGQPERGHPGGRHLLLDGDAQKLEALLYQLLMWGPRFASKWFNKGLVAKNYNISILSSLFKMSYQVTFMKKNVSLPFWCDDLFYISSKYMWQESNFQI